MKHVSKWLKTHNLHVRAQVHRGLIQLTAYDLKDQAVAAGEGAGMAQAFFSLMNAYNVKRVCGTAPH
jgi:hypothetical protein